MKKTTFLMLLVSSVGIIIFLIVTSLVPFKDNLFSNLYAKPLSKAAEGPEAPSVELTILNYDEKQVNLNSNQTPLILSWKAINVTECIGRSFGISDKDTTWSGSKSLQGTFQTLKLSTNNPYVYTIDCANELGDAAGDSVVINIGAESTPQKPYITSLDLGKNDPSKIVKIPLSEAFILRWSALNLSTPYSICIASGSWPTQYTNIKTEVIESFSLEAQKVHRYSLYCSNEGGSARKDVTFIPI